MNQQLDLNIINGQIDAFFGSSQKESPGVKPREQYCGNYDSYLRGVRQVEDKRKALQAAAKS